MVFAILVFLFGSILCGSAQDMNWLIAARVVQGLGGGGCLSLASVIISDITTLRERPKFLSYGSVRVGLGDEYWSKLVGGSFEVFPAHRGE
jgi:MFS family permease